MGADVGDRRYSAAILLTGTGSLHGEPEWAIRQAEEAGVIYNCSVEDGSCGYGVHTSEPGPSSFWHLSAGCTDDDYERVTEERDDPDLRLAAQQERAALAFSLVHEIEAGER